MKTVESALPCVLCVKPMTGQLKLSEKGDGQLLGEDHVVNTTHSQRWYCGVLALKRTQSRLIKSQPLVRGWEGGEGGATIVPVL
jgi:hypothetical protein